MHTLSELRKDIDELDYALLLLLQKRVALMKKVGKVKKALQQPIRDPQREQEQRMILTEQAKQLDLPLSLVLSIWNLFFKASEELEK